MAALRGVMDYGHHAGSVHRLAYDDISAHLSTWQTHCYIHIDRYGRVGGWIARKGKTIKTFGYFVPEISKKEMVTDIETRRKRKARL